ncbi:MAG: DUF4910 domain-containing protein, partial [Lachnospiraceae bacterium]|nr:DUF4910 domain-containing protein [Lachnospiraceae bacterium]
MLQYKDCVGQDIYELAGKLFPIYRSLTGEGVRQTLEEINCYLGKDMK